MIIMKEEQEQFMQEMFMKVGVSSEDARITAQSLTLADLRGVNSHGILRLPIYVQRLKRGLMANKPDIRIEKEDMTTAVMDGGNYIAQVTGRIAMRKAIEKASENTLGMVLVKNSNHFGAAAEYSIMAAKEGMIGIAASNTVPLMPPPGGKDKVVGNNPLAVSFPGGRYGIVSVDMAMSSVAQGKIRNAELNNREVPLGWGIDKEGKDTTNPRDILDGGFLLPTGGPKGYGLAIAIEILAAALSNSPVSKEVKSIYQLEEKLGISHMFLVINAKALIDQQDYNNRVETLLDIIKNCPAAYGIEEIYFPGEIEDNIMKDRLANGMVITREMELELDKLADELNVKRIKSFLKNRQLREGLV